MKNLLHILLALCFISIAALVACKKKSNPAPTAFQVGGTVTGNSGPVVLTNTYGGQEEELTVSSPGNFTFQNLVSNGTSFEVKIKSIPNGQNCTISNNTGTINGANFSNVQVDCEDLPPNEYVIGGEVTGLEGSLTLVNTTNNEELTVTSNGPFFFPTSVANGANYDIQVKTQPAGAFCTVANGSGTVSGANVTNIAVTCSAAAIYTIGGTVSGLSSGSFKITNNGVDTLTITANGPFTFSIPLANSSPYDVDIAMQVDGGICSVTNGTGTVSGANVTNVSISCESIPLDGDQYFATDSEDPSIFYQFQNDLSLNALSTNGFGDNSIVVGLAYNPFSNKIYAFARNTQKLLEVNPSTGVATEIGDLAVNIGDLAFNKNLKKLYAVEATLGNLLELDTTNADITLVYQDDNLKTMSGLTYDPVNNLLYGTDAGQRLVTIGTTVPTMGVTAIGTTSGLYNGLAFDDDTEKLFGMEGNELAELFEINTATAAETTIGNVGYGFPGGLAFNDNINQIYGTSSNGNGKLFLVDETLATATTSIGSTGIETTKGIAYSTNDNQFYVINPNDLMYTLNESSGESTFKYQISAGIGNFGLTYDDEGDQFFTITQDQKLGLINRSNGTGDVKTPTFTRTLVDLAYDKVNNVLYGASAQELVTINTSTGAVSNILSVKNLSGDISSISYDATLELIIATQNEPQPVVAIDPASGNSAEVVDTDKSFRGIVRKE